MKYKTYLKKRDNDQLALITEFYDINVIDVTGINLGKCEVVEVWHNDGGLNYPSYFVLRKKDDDSYAAAGDDIVFSLTEDTIKFDWIK